MSQRLLILILILILSIKIDVFGQAISNDIETSKVNFFEANISYFQPIGIFKENGNPATLGFELGYLRQLKTEKPIFWGVSTYFTRLTSTNAILQELLDFNLVDISFNTSNYIGGVNGKLRFYPDLNLGFAELYFEALLGGKWLYTTTTKTLFDSTDDTSTFFDDSSWSWTYGVAAGINIPIKNNIYINTRVNYLPGISASYYIKDEKNNIQTNTIDQYKYKNSITDLIRWDVGITFWPTISY